MLSEIGSNFWITPEQLKALDRPLPHPSDLFSCPGTDYRWLTSCRQCIEYALEELENSKCEKIALIPPYTCHTVVQPFLNKQYKVVTYPVDATLCTSVDDLMENAERTRASVVLVHQYFGFNSVKGDFQLFNQLRRKGVTIIEDCTQSLYSSIQRIPADYYVASIRKWCGVPDGGYVVSSKGRFSKEVSPYTIELQQKKEQASLLKYQFLFLNSGEKDEFLKGYADAESILANQDNYRSITDLSVKIQNNLDVDALKKARRDNYKVLCEGLRDNPSIKILWPDFPDGVVPLYFPFIVGDRIKMQSILREHSIYAPIIWPKPDNLEVERETENYLYSHLLCIPVDQRYDNDDMQRVIKVINEKS